MIQEIVDSIEDLTSFPPLAHRALAIATDDAAGVDDLIELVQYDPAVTSNCLKLCNSSYYGLSEKVSSLKQALVLLGMGNVIRILLTNCIKLPEYDQAHRGYGLHEGDLWRHSVSSAVLSGRLSASTGARADASLFTAALLHDVGKLALNRFMEERFRELCELIRNRSTLIQAEKEIFGIHHAELGGMIAAAWNFPEVLVHSIRYHHEPMDEGATPDVAAWVRLSNMVSHVAAFRSTCLHLDALTCNVKSRILAPFGLTPEAIETVCEQHAAEMLRTDALFAEAE